MFVFDSLSEDEETIKSNFYINPNSSFRLILDFCVLIVIIYSGVFTSLRLVRYYYSSFLTLLLEFSLDLFFITDFISSFFNAYLDIEENYINAFSKIIKNYLESSFALDLLCGFPVNSICELNDFLTLNSIGNFNTETLFSVNQDSYSLDNLQPQAWRFSDLSMRRKSILQFFRLFRVAKILKIFLYSENQFLQKINELFFTSENHFYNILKHFALMYSILIIISNILSCVFIYIAASLNNQKTNWITFADLQNADFSEIYLASFYFTHTTVFSVGYGDITSKSIEERLFNLLLMILGVFLFSFALTALSNVIKTSAEKLKYYHENMQYLNDVGKTHEINNVLYEKISQHFFFVYNSNEKSKSILINDLPITLRREIILNMNKDLISKCRFFKNLFNKEFLVEILNCLKTTISHENEALIFQGDFVDEVIFIRKGVL